MPDVTLTLTVRDAPLPAGRETDVAIAIGLFGWTRQDNDLGPDYLLPPPGSSSHREGRLQKVPHFSTQLQAAWAIVDRLRSRDFCMIVYDYGRVQTVPEANQWQVVFIGHGHGAAIQCAASAATFWLAICRAALKTL